MWLRVVNHCPHTDIFLAARGQRLQRLQLSSRRSSWPLSASAR